ncbi:putative short chain dehydrogenase/reductase family oxidoreductase [Blattamonas nauphoetae]|uniref:Short chain dehydrogenase/reductase family oxidoreductase n=1 Tax=Blattamonas nauphoetae TaxID=2049346 RepID=A0ABQ9WSU5_9EUKA|nr:putative short chain dehydrogenase/reductase family oxidoreductase [Blattamonas nauphoetae]
METELSESQIADALSLLHKIEANPDLILGSNLKPLKKQLGHTFMAVHKDDFKLKQVRKQPPPIPRKDAKKQDMIALQTSAMVKQRKEARRLSTISHSTFLESSEQKSEQPEPTEPVSETFYPSRCYICNAEYWQLHFFYHKLCPACAALNWQKRFSCADLRGKIAICTGARVKIGHQCCLRLLHCGAFVIATTRFPNDAAIRFIADPFFASYSNRLHIYGLDFRDLTSVHRFADFIVAKYPRLDMIINNAAQTVRKPASFYSHLIENELKPLEELPKQIVPLRIHDPQYESEASKSLFRIVDDPLAHFHNIVHSPSEMNTQNTSTLRQPPSVPGMDNKVETATGVLISGDVHNLYSSARPLNASLPQTSDTPTHPSLTSSDAEQSEPPPDLSPTMQCDVGVVVSADWPFIVPEYQVVSDALVHYAPRVTEVPQRKHSSESDSSDTRKSETMDNIEEEQKNDGNEGNTAESEENGEKIVLSSQTSTELVSTHSLLPTPAPSSLVFATTSSGLTKRAISQMSLPFGGEMEFVLSETDPALNVEMRTTTGKRPTSAGTMSRLQHKQMRHNAKKASENRRRKGPHPNKNVEVTETMQTRTRIELRDGIPVTNDVFPLQMTDKQKEDLEQRVAEGNRRQKRCPVDDEVNPQNEKRAMSVRVTEPDEDDKFITPAIFHPLGGVDERGTLSPSSSSVSPSSALMSQFAVDPIDSTPLSSFNMMLRDTDNQPIDTRTHNSWVARMDQVSSVELVEVHLINSFAPFILISRLEALMAQDQTTNHFVVNVSAMEGKFHRNFKSFYHPHTNMAKASLNMLTRTSASDLARKRIFMNAVDTGWITDEKPLHAAVRAEEGGFSPPLDEVDAMARILDPVFVGINTGVLHFGKFFKDYFVTEW